MGFTCSCISLQNKSLPIRPVILLQLKREWAEKVGEVRFWSWSRYRPSSTKPVNLALTKMCAQLVKKKFQHLMSIHIVVFTNLFVYILDHRVMLFRELCRCWSLAFCFTSCFPLLLSLCKPSQLQLCT